MTYQHPDILNCDQQSMVVEIEWEPDDLDDPPPQLRCKLCGVLLDELDESPDERESR